METDVSPRLLSLKWILISLKNTKSPCLIVMKALITKKMTALSEKFYDLIVQHNCNISIKSSFGKYILK